MNFIKKALNISNNNLNNNNNIENNTDDKDDFVLVNDGLSQSVWVDINNSNNNNNKQSLPIYQVTHDTPIYHIGELPPKIDEQVLEEEEMTEEEENTNSLIISQVLTKSVSDIIQLQLIVPIVAEIPPQTIEQEIEIKVPTEQERIIHIKQSSNKDSSYTSTVDASQLRGGRTGRTIQSQYSTSPSSLPHVSPSNTSIKDSYTSNNVDVKPYTSASKTTQPYSYAY